MENNTQYFEGVDIEKLISNPRLVVNCKTKDEAKDFVDYVSRDQRMRGSVELFVRFWDRFKEKTCYRVTELDNGITLRYGSLRSYSRGGSIIIPYSQVDLREIEELEESDLPIDYILGFV